MKKKEGSDGAKDIMGDLPMWAGNDFERAKAPKARGEREPATELMKTVATKTDNVKNLGKVFTYDEIEEILMRRDDGEVLTPVEHKAIRDKYRKMKRQVKEMEEGNKEKQIWRQAILAAHILVVSNF